MQQLRSKLLLAMLLMCITSFASPMLTQTVNINLTNAMLKSLFTTIERQTSYRFSYKSSDIDNRHDVTVKKRNASVSSVLSEVLPSHQLDYRIVSNNTIAITKASEKAQPRMTPASYQQKSKVVEGTIMDSKGEPIIGATVFDPVSKRGAVTDINGHYRIDCAPGTKLRVSYVGYTTKEIVAGHDDSVSLSEEDNTLNDVVVVGYGTQKKLTTTGAVTKVEGTNINRMTVTNASKALQGISPGLTIVDRGGAPGEDDPEIYMRGVSTTGYSQPLVLVDGIEMPMNQVPASEIENVSVLKDAASAAIYGSRAANGVILITTKRGKTGKPRVSYSGSIGVQDRATKPKAVSAEEYMSLVNEALVNAGSEPKYSGADIQAVLSGSDPYRIGYTVWPDKVYKPNYVTQHTLSVNGGSENSKYLASFDYLDQPGLTKNTTFKRYSYRMNADINIGKYVRFSNDFTFRHFDREYPQLLGNAQYRAYSMNPCTPMRYEDSRYQLDSQNLNPVSYLDKAVSGMNEYNRDALYGQLKLEVEPIKDLVFTGVVALDGQWQRNKIHYKNFKYYDAAGTTMIYQLNNPNGVRDERNNSYELTLRFLANYKKTFCNHNFAILFGAEQISYRNYYSMAQRNNLISDNLPDVSLGSAGKQFADGYPTKWGINSFFGRFNYNWKERYLFETNVRSDGSSRFAAGHRWGTFPSFSAAWRISEEPFMKGIKWLSNLKLRASWGQTGNEHIDAYQYLAQYSTSNVIMDNALVTGVFQRQMSNPDITWETVEQTDIGLDFGFLNNKLYGTFDYYIKDTKDILLALGIPHFIGLDAPMQNAGKVRNSGFEFTFGYRDHFGPVNFNGSFNLAYNKNEWRDRGSDTKNINGYIINAVGSPLNAFYIYQADGLIANDQELAEYKSSLKSDPRGMSEVTAGDVKLVDVNHDGTIDPNDRVICNPNIPKFNFGINLQAEWKGVDLSAVFQGATGANMMMYGEFIEGPCYEVFTSTIFRDRWTEENQNANAKIPRLVAANNRNESTYNTFYLWKTNYLRLKNLQIGYTFKQPWVHSVGISDLRIYLSGSNLFSWTSLPSGLDPEGNSNRITNFPQLKIYSFGINVSF